MQSQSLITASNNLYVADCSRDGKWLVYEESKAEQPQAAMLKAFPLVPGAKPVPLLDGVDSNSNARLEPSSNGWIAYQSSESGSPQVFVTKFPEPGAKYQVSSAGGSQPVWSKDGKKLYYLDAFLKLTAVDIRVAKDSVQIGAQKTLFQTAVRSSVPAGAYDVTHDGRFLILNSVVDYAAPIVLVTDWDAELKR